MLSHDWCNRGAGLGGRGVGGAFDLKINNTPNSPIITIMRLHTLCKGSFKYQLTLFLTILHSITYGDYYWYSIKVSLTCFLCQKGKTFSINTLKSICYFGLLWVYFGSAVDVTAGRASPQLLCPPAQRPFQRLCTDCVENQLVGAAACRAT